jgi:hypothetical protein
MEDINLKERLLCIDKIRLHYLIGRANWWRGVRACMAGRLAHGPLIFWHIPIVVATWEHGIWWGAESFKNWARWDSEAAGIYDSRQGIPPHSHTVTEAPPSPLSKTEKEYLCHNTNNSYIYMLTRKDKRILILMSIVVLGSYNLHPFFSK